MPQKIKVANETKSTQSLNTLPNLVTRFSSQLLATPNRFQPISQNQSNTTIFSILSNEPSTIDLHDPHFYIQETQIQHNYNIVESKLNDNNSELSLTQLQGGRYGTSNKTTFDELKSSYSLQDFLSKHFTF